MCRHAVAIGRIVGAAQALEPGEILVAEQSGDDDRCSDQISTWLPSSTTRLVGSLKNSIALSALRSIHANSFSRQIAMPGRDEASRVCRARKQIVSIILHCGPIALSCASAEGTSISSMKP